MVDVLLKEPPERRQQVLGGRGSYHLFRRNRAHGLGVGDAGLNQVLAGNDTDNLSGVALSHRRSAPLGEGFGKMAQPADAGRMCGSGQRSGHAGRVSRSQSRKSTTVYTDGACSGNPGPGGWAWAVPDGPYRSGAETHTTNQRME